MDVYNVPKSTKTNNDDELKKLGERTDKLELHKNMQIDENRKVSRKVDELEKKINNWEDEFYFVKDKIRNSDKKPHKCPICDGVGQWELQSLEQIMKNYGSKNLFCKPCEGKGIVWG